MWSGHQPDFHRGRNSMKKAVGFSALLVVALICGVWTPQANAKAVYGSILGTVTDASGAAVNGAKVTVRSQTKNVSTEATTNETGNYSVTHLIPDVYTVHLAAAHFKLLSFKDIPASPHTVPP